MKKIEVACRDEIARGDYKEANNLIHEYNYLLSSIPAYIRDMYALSEKKFLDVPVLSKTTRCGGLAEARKRIAGLADSCALDK